MSPPISRALSYHCPEPCIIWGGGKRGHYSKRDHVKADLRFAKRHNSGWPLCDGFEVRCLHNRAFGQNPKWYVWDKSDTAHIYKNNCMMVQNTERYCCLLKQLERKSNNKVNVLQKCFIFKWISTWARERGPPGNEGSSFQCYASYVIYLQLTAQSVFPRC